MTRVGDLAYGFLFDGPEQMLHGLEEVAAHYVENIVQYGRWQGPLKTLEEDVFATLDYLRQLDLPQSVSNFWHESPREKGSDLFGVGLFAAPGLRALMEDSIVFLKAELAKFSWDSDRDLILLEKEHVLKIINKFLRGEIKKIDVGKWAEAIEGREDIGFEVPYNKLINEIIFELSNPDLAGELKGPFVELGYKCTKGNQTWVLKVPGQAFRGGWYESKK